MNDGKIVDNIRASDYFVNLTANQNSSSKLTHVNYVTVEVNIFKSLNNFSSGLLRVYLQIN